MRAHRVASEIEAGSIYVNNYNVYPVGVPFGGYKKSGLGRENGPEALDIFTQVKSVYMEMTWMPPLPSTVNRYFYANQGAKIQNRKKW
jgi:acyl-CoA reductase-like NAD-dependent aldehyde dehydrogenase